MFNMWEMLTMLNGRVHFPSQECFKISQPFLKTCRLMDCHRQFNSKTFSLLGAFGPQQFSGSLGPNPSQLGLLSSPGQASRSKPRPTFTSCMQNDLHDYTI